MSPRVTRFALALVIATVALVGAPSAFALRPVLDPAYDAELEALLQDPNHPVWTGGGTDAKRGASRMLMAGKAIAPLSAAGAIAVAPTLYEKAWKMELPGQGFLYKMISGDAYAGSMSTGGAEWLWTTAGSGSGYNFAAGQTPGNRWVLRRLSAPGGGLQGIVYCWPNGASVPGWFNVLADSMSGTAFLTTLPGGGACASSNVTHIKVRTPLQMEQAVNVQPITETEYNGFGGAKVDTGLWTPPTLDLTAARDVIGLGDAASDAIAERVDEHLNPHYQEVQLPRPLTNETWEDYVERLEGLGWLGEADIVELNVTEPGYGPEAPVRIRVPQPDDAPTIVLDPKRWPTADPWIPEGGDITIHKNPPASPPVADPVPLPPPAGTPGGGDCDCPPVDFGPLTSIDYGDGFPFGIFGWVTDGISPWDDPADAPTFEVPLLGLGSDTPVVVDLAVWEPMMPAVRVAIAFLFAFGLYYGLARRFFPKAPEVGEQLTLFDS